MLSPQECGNEPKGKGQTLRSTPVKGAPLLLYNAWDAGSAQSVLEAGAKAIATSSWSVAAAQGYQDGEAIPIELAEKIVGRIATSVDAPVTVDFEGGYTSVYLLSSSWDEQLGIKSLVPLADSRLVP
jgi:2-methylisocitrate lyase-like PEP mutase family enzyme